MDGQYLRILEYNKILAQLAEHTAFSASRELALALMPSAETYDVERALNETTEAKSLLSTRTDVSVGAAHDVRPLAKRASLGAMLQPPDLLDVRSTLRSAHTLQRLLTRVSAEHPLLGEKAGLLVPLPHLIDAIAQCLDDEGRVLDSASPELARIRRESSIARDRLVERLRRIVMSSDGAKYLQDPIITERNGRYVVPLKVEFKGRIPGIIHDQSSSGATLFIEPLSTVDFNNRWHELQLAEQREIERILSELSAAVGREADYIEHDVALLAELDLAFAKAHYSFELHARPAILTDSRWPVAEPGTALEASQHPLSLLRARHPLLPADEVVPIDAHLGGDYTVLLITGPNTGGKTVALKTIGLLAAMSQAGMHIPVGDGSCLPVFSGIYADIGDEQSIEQSLSTFSSHMTHIVDILGRADTGSLVLLDELGAGTDPVEGAALAQALITQLVDSGCLLACSTHYSQLKVFAFSTPGVQNASVEFDLATLSPTYRLIIGAPGRSNAFAIAQHLGLRADIIERAEGFLTPEDREADNLLGSVRAANDAALRDHAAAERSRAQAEDAERTLQKKLGQIEEVRRQVLDQTRAQGREELDHLRQEIRRLRLGLASTGPAAQSIREAPEVIDRLEQEIAPIQPTTAPAPKRQKTLEVGDMVHVTTLDQTGELVDISGQEGTVRIGGSFRMRARLDAIEFRSRPQHDPQEASSSFHRPMAASPGTELDMRGWRAEEVAPTLDKYLDDAYLAGLPWVQIIHGKGMGVLKSVVREFLSDHPLVASYRPGAITAGGEGVTVAKLHPHSD